MATPTTSSDPSGSTSTPSLTQVQEEVVTAIPTAVRREVQTAVAREVEAAVSRPVSLAVPPTPPVIPPTHPVIPPSLRRLEVMSCIRLLSCLHVI